MKLSSMFSTAAGAKDLEEASLLSPHFMDQETSFDFSKASCSKGKDTYIRKVFLFCSDKVHLCA
jgi:hypothetical protein